jgi:polysaccharide deacetylase 2 family uncharacterized protein YibQ
MSSKKKRFRLKGFPAGFFVFILTFILIIIASFLIREYFYKPKAKIAIVLDDWGYSLANLPVLYEIKRPITVSVLPNLKYSKQIARDVEKRGYEVLLHLPLESKGGRDAEPGTICCKMSDEEISERFKKALEGVPGVLGVNNHQGSKATENKHVMGILLPQIKKAKLFFLDSVTTGKSICPEICRRIGLRSAKRDVFLDRPAAKLKGKDLEDYIRQQLYQLSDEAIGKGWAIGIGHDRKTTLKVIKDMALELENKGVKFVRVSDIIDGMKRHKDKQ